MQEKTVSKIREFNRFYLPALGLLGNQYLGSEYSAAEARVLFEIYRADGCNAAYIAKALNIDKSYLSRIIKKYERNGYLFRIVSEKDSRAFELHLTKKGLQRVEDFIRRSNLQIGGILQPLTDKDREKLLIALDTIVGILKKCKPSDEIGKIGEVIYEDRSL